MNTRILSQYRNRIQALFVGLIAVLILAACSGTPSPAEEAIPSSAPTDVPTQALLPTDTQPPAEKQAPIETLAPVETQAMAPTPAKPASSLTSVCALITKEEAEAALGSPVKDPVEQNVPPVFSCRYDDTEGIYFVDISVVEFDNAEQADAVYQMAIDLNNYQEVSGIGERAYTSPIYAITVNQGRYELSVSVVNAEDDEAEFEKSKSLAASALDRLP